MFVNNKKTAIVYDRINKWGGAERVLLALHEIFPKAPLYTSVYSEKTARWAKVFPTVYTSFLQKIKFLRTKHELLAPFMPLAFESFDFSGYDTVISVTSEAAKGIITSPNTKHICYMLTPTRYLWSGYNEYFQRDFKKVITKPIVKYLRKWDKVAAQRPDKVIAISTEVRKRIKKYYQRNSEIVYPPVEVNRIKNQESRIKNQNYYLVVGRLVAYKKVDLVVRAFNELKEKLVIVGIGSQEKYLKRIANKNIIFTGFVKERQLLEFYKNAKAFIFPQLEDFGITAVEAQAAGVPVIAYKAGGALDTVIDNRTGIYFEKQTVDSLKEAVLRFKRKKFNRGSIINNAEKFSEERFKKDFIKISKL
ncbi:glycosyltransferase [Candidatus Woesebacteria bacterium]|nr:glycosyltransferase [Candidatus Woesebacteria bacterium]